MKVAHGSAEAEGLPEGAHESGRYMFERLSLDYFWPTMLEDCEKFRRSCFVCKARENITHKYGLLDPTTGDKLEGKDVVYLDLAGPFTPAPSGENYIVVAVKAKTGWIEAMPIEGNEAATIIAAFRKGYVPQHGVPTHLVTDRASNLLSEVATTFYAEMGMEKRTATAYHPQGDGAGEAAVKAVKSPLAKVLLDFGEGWWDRLPDVLMRLRSGQKQPNMMSPFKAERRIQMQLPSAWLNPQTEGPLTPQAETWQKIDKAVMEARNEAAAEYKEKYDKGRMDKVFKAGERVVAGARAGQRLGAEEDRAVSDQDGDLAAQLRARGGARRTQDRREARDSSHQPHRGVRARVGGRKRGESREDSGAWQAHDEERCAVQVQGPVARRR